MFWKSALVVVSVAALAAAPAVSARAVTDDSVIAKACGIVLSTESSVDRISGADRYEVSARISAENFSPHVPIAFVASGTSFPDALSGAAAAGKLGGPVLLVGPGDEASAAVRDELTRLQPDKIVVLGGTASVSTALELTMERFAPSVRRVSGADRFEVSAELARQVFSTTARTIYVASGEVFPDALSAAAAAGDASAPVLLVKKNEVPPAVESYLDSQGILDQIVLVGGPATVSDTVARDLAKFARLQGIQGADRFAVSAATSGWQFCTDRHTVFIASGEVFPDALSGSAAAIAQGGPVLLVSKNDISLQVEQELQRLNPQHIVVLGGENTISKALELKLADYLRK
ncbi:cell wall-binding repeat-containing protein [Herbiconiux sp. P18]|uniref:cell wall-binding repeat-containing protein n=1 Tax=Herbiconiux liangxiaofengii TaxID=3342795 RepID=UPI0035B72431